MNRKTFTPLGDSVSWPSPIPAGVGCRSGEVPSPLGRIGVSCGDEPQTDSLLPQYLGRLVPEAGGIRFLGWLSTDSSVGEA